MSGLSFVCLVGINVKNVVIAASLRDSAMAAVMSSILVMGWWLMAMIVLSHGVERQRGMCNTGVEGKHNFSWIRLLSKCWRRLSPRVGWSTFLTILMSIDALK